MPYCSKCGAELDGEATFCPKCGTPAGPPVTKPERRTTHGRRRKQMSTLAIILIALITAAVVVAAVLAAAFFLGAWHPFGQIIGSGNLITQEKSFSDFSAVDVGSGFEVEITQSSSYTVKITADDNVLDHIIVSKTGDTLTIRLRLGYSFQSVTLRGKITMPELRELELSGGTHGTVKGFSSSHEFVAELSEGSHLSGDLRTSGDAKFSLSGGSHLSKLDGAASDLGVSASSGSHVDLSDFPVHDASVNLNGGSHATINVDGRLDADLSGGSHLFYIGDPTMGDIETSGGSTVSKNP
ncbi:MAG: DUF2807 domain-containing protein [Candidatus Bathyarchaeota archaeon]|nr:MAG: DUF2807 domain-containing protein [Candidatus Bathyarchaeota archaeon]